jgi:hypothetical protein
VRVEHRVLVATGTAIAILTGSTHAQSARELAGNSLTQFPFFEYVKAINEGSPVRLGIDPGHQPGPGRPDGRRLRHHPQDHRRLTSQPALVDVSGGIETLTISAASIQANTSISGRRDAERRCRHPARGGL